jgi:hypothetical protein
MKEGDFREFVWAGANERMQLTGPAFAASRQQVIAAGPATDSQR